MKVMTVALVAAAALAAATPSFADDLWDGGPNSGTLLWSADTNWLDDTAPSVSAGGVITFTNLALGAVNEVDDDRVVTTLRYHHNVAGLAHTTAIASARTLTIAGGALAVGENRSNCWVTVTGGTLQLGTESAPADLQAGAHNRAPSGTGWTSNGLSLAVSIDGVNWSNLWAGRQAYLSSSLPAEGFLDLSACTIRSAGEDNKLLLSGSLVVGGGGGRYPNGELRLPPALTEIAVDVFELANGSGPMIGRSLLDLGENAQLARFTARSGCHFGKDGVVTLLGWPVGVEMTVGLPGAPAPMSVGCSQANLPGISGQLALTNGSFTAWLSSLKVGCTPYTGGNAVTTGILDLASTTVCVGGATNSIVLGELVVGGDRGRNPRGFLYLPAAVTNLEAASIEVAAGSGTFSGDGLIHFGEGSALRAFTVAGPCSLGNPGSATLAHFPTGVAIRVGRPAEPAPLAVGCSAGGYAATRFAPTNGTLTAWLSALLVGCNNNIGAGTAGTIDGELDLSTCRLEVGGAPDRLAVPELRVGGQGGRYTRGTLRLPPAVTNITVGLFEVCSTYGPTPGSALLDLSEGAQLRTLIASNGFTLGSGGPGEIRGLPGGVEFVIGRPDAPAPMILGSSTMGGNPVGLLVLEGGSFTAWLSSLKIGCNSYISGGSAITGVLDLASATVQIGARPNSVEVPELLLGSGKGRRGNGTLRLPASVTNLSVGTLEIGAGYLTQYANGLLDFGTDSGLQMLTVSNGLTLAYMGYGAITNLPPGVDFRIGAADAPAPLVIGFASNNQAVTMTPELRLPPQTRFTGHLASLDLGVSEHPYQQAYLTAAFDLTNGCRLESLTVTGDVRIGYSVATSNLNGRGFLLLPEGEAAIGGSLLLGDAHAGSRGVLWLDGTRVAVGGRVELGAGTGFVTGRLAGASAGLDLLSADTNDLAIGPGGRIALLFTADPVSRSEPYWGLRMRGQAVEFVQSLTATPAVVTCDTAGLSAESLKLFGVHYDMRSDTTWLGVAPGDRGTVILVR